jgi:hypothetical protein
MDVGIIFFAILEIGGPGRIENTVSTQEYVDSYIYF